MRSIVSRLMPSIGFPICMAYLLQQVMGQERNILLPIPQGRKLDGKDVQPVEQVFAECLLANGLARSRLVAAITRTSTCCGVRAADTVEFALLEDAQQFRLNVERQLADFVQEDRSAVGQFEAADAAGDGAGEGPFFMAEQLAFHQASRQCRAVDLDQRLVAPLAGGMNGPGDQFFARARLAADQHG